MNNERIFILEDDPNIIDIYKKMFKKHYNVDIAKNLKESITLLEDNPEYDLYIIDIYINGSKFNGLDLANFLPDKKIIIHTALDLKSFINYSHKQYEYVQKPPKQNLLKIVDKFFKKMKISEIGVSLIKKYESLKLEAYLCPAGKWTIGYGHTRTAYKGMVITEKQANDLLRSDLEIVETGINNIIKELDINQNQYDALVSFVFNVGINAFKSSTLLKRIKAKESNDKIKEAFMMWRFGGSGEHNGRDDDGDGLIDEPGEKQLLLGLVKRRNDEAELFLTI